MVQGQGVLCCESLGVVSRLEGPKASTPRFAQGSTCFFVLNRVVSSVVTLMRSPVDLRSPSHNTDAQNTARLLHDVVTPPSDEPHGGSGGSRAQIPPSRPEGTAI